MPTIAKHSGKMTSQLKTAEHSVLTSNRPPVKPRKKKEAISIARRAQGDITTVTVGSISFYNTVIDLTMMSQHVAKKLQLKLKPCSRGIQMAGGKFEQLLDITGKVDFYVAGIGGRMKMGVNDGNRSYDFLLGDDWLMFVKAEAI